MQAPVDRGAESARAAMHKWRWHGLLAACVHGGSPGLHACTSCASLMAGKQGVGCRNAVCMLQPPPPTPHHPPRAFDGPASALLLVQAPVSSRPCWLWRQNYPPPPPAAPPVPCFSPAAPQFEHEQAYTHLPTHTPPPLLAQHPTASGPAHTHPAPALRPRTAMHAALLQLSNWRDGYGVAWRRRCYLSSGVAPSSEQLVLYLDSRSWSRCCRGACPIWTP